MAPLSAAALCRALGIGEAELRALEGTGRVFSVFRSTRDEREYPSFLAWPELRGERLNQVLDLVNSAENASGTEAYGFFGAVTDLLAYLTPVEVLTGCLLFEREIDGNAARLLAMTDELRTAAVLAAAQAHVDLRSSC